ncbi:FG-GAP-like repeat-containing protein [Hymenobacter sp. DH14]|uniref:FG-GAP-like repeat-containing protein n=1 Tax=Hymenobacter cyanobacteriorum TaxID=2926463 RepID=A0A9X2AEM9_9BACT|nr:FG-GAP-like repeat-containing protein [Hymenobacter cyanobacteriorum]MCI1187401.1 FG-GAP-like repeat-containing protein [Hymenobacter cyanobacteriorum]
MKHFCSITCLLFVFLNSSLARAQGPAVVGTALSPVRNAPAVPRTASVVIPFSQPVNPATAGNIKMFSSQYRGSRTATTSTNANAATLLPTAPAGQSAAFKPGETVSVTVPATVLGTNGAGTVPYVYQFTAAATGGSGSFALNGDISVAGGDWACEVRVGDLDGDGDLDVVTNSGSPNSFSNITVGKINVLLNNGTGSYTAAPAIVVPLGPSSVALGDIDSDLDILSANHGNDSGNGNTVSICFNNGTGTFASPVNLIVAQSPQRIKLGDMDGDGDLDLVVNGSLTQVFFNNGSGGFSNSTAPGSPGGSITRSGSNLADMDGDGSLDLVGPGGIYRNNGQGSFTAVAGTSGGYYNDAIGDIDGDGDLDVITVGNVNTSLFGSNVLVQKNDGTGRVAATTTLTISSTSTYPTIIPCVALGDIDGDGDLDLLAGFSNNQLGIAVWQNDGQGHFMALPSFSGNVQAMNMVLADVDGDGDLDIVASIYSGYNVKILLNTTTLATTTARPARLVTLYPNPAASAATVQLSRAGMSTSAATQVTIYNGLGQVVAVSTLHAGQDTNTLPTAHLPAGCYMVRLQSADGNSTQRLVLY